MEHSNALSSERIPLSLAAFSAILECSQDAIRRYVAGIIGDDDEAQDITQEVFAAAWRQATVWLESKEGFPPSRGLPPFLVPPGDSLARLECIEHLREVDEGMRRWLFRVAENKAKDALRKRYKGRLISYLMPDFDPPETDALGQTRLIDVALSEQQINDSTLREALAKLDPKTRACFLLHGVDGLSVAEVASTLGITFAAAKKNIARARQRLKATCAAAFPSRVQDVKERKPK